MRWKINKTLLVLTIFLLGYMFHDLTGRSNIEIIKNANANILWSYRTLMKDSAFNKAVKAIVVRDCEVPDPTQRNIEWMGRIQKEPIGMRMVAGERLVAVRCNPW